MIAENSNCLVPLRQQDGSLASQPIADPVFLPDHPPCAATHPASNNILGKIPPMPDAALQKLPALPHFSWQPFQRTPFPQQQTPIEDVDTLCSPIHTARGSAASLLRAPSSPPLLPPISLLTETSLGDTLNEPILILPEDIDAEMLPNPPPPPAPPRCDVSSFGRGTNYYNTTTGNDLNLFNSSQFGGGSGREAPPHDNLRNHLFTARNFTLLGDDEVRTHRGGTAAVQSNGPMSYLPFPPPHPLQHPLPPPPPSSRMNTSSTGMHQHWNGLLPLPPIAMMAAMHPLHASSLGAAAAAPTTATVNTTRPPLAPSTNATAVHPHQYQHHHHHQQNASLGVAGFSGLPMPSNAAEAVIGIPAVSIGMIPLPLQHHHPSATTTQDQMDIYLQQLQAFQHLQQHQHQYHLAPLVVSTSGGGATFSSSIKSAEAAMAAAPSVNLASPATITSPGTIATPSTGAGIGAAGEDTARKELARQRNKEAKQRQRKREREEIDALGEELDTLVAQAAAMQLDNERMVNAAKMNEKCLLVRNSIHSVFDMKTSSDISAAINAAAGTTHVVQNTCPPPSLDPKTATFQKSNDSGNTFTFLSASVSPHDISECISFIRKQHVEVLHRVEDAEDDGFTEDAMLEAAEAFMTGYRLLTSLSKSSMLVYGAVMDAFSDANANTPTTSNNINYKKVAAAGCVAARLSQETLLQLHRCWLDYAVVENAEYQKARAALASMLKIHISAEAVVDEMSASKATQHVELAEQMSKLQVFVEKQCKAYSDFIDAVVKSLGAFNCAMIVATSGSFFPNWRSVAIELLAEFERPCLNGDDGR